MPETLFMAFIGGIFGTALGALWSFCLCGLLTLTGCLLVLGGGSDFLLLQIGLGPLFGPHAGGFLSGVIAASYASARGKHPGGSGRDILSPLMGTSWDVLAVGGLAALAGVLLVSLISKVPVLRESDHLALAIILATFTGRGLFHREGPFGQKKSIAEHSLLGTNSYALSWIGWMSPPPLLFMIGASAGGLSGFMAKMTAEVLTPLAASGVVSPAAAGTVPVIFGWAFSAIMLIALQLGQGSIQKVPVTHGIAILGALSYLYTGSLAGAVIGGILGAFLQELCARLFINHASDHLDPPATAIAIGSFMLNLLFKPDWLGLSAAFMIN